MSNNFIKVHFRYSEVGLKGRNLKTFEQILMSNIKKSLSLLRFGVNKISIIQKQGVIYLSNVNNDIANILEKLILIPGIEWAGVVVFQKSFIDLEDIISSISNFFIKNDFFNVKLDVKRYDKTLTFNSNDIWLNVVKILHKVMVHERDDELNTKGKQRFRLFIYKGHFELVKVQTGVGGLPVGSTGKGLVLFSGGIDSPVATFLMAKRGIKFDLLHFTPLNSEKIKETKIYKLYKHLKYFNSDSRLFIANIPFIYQNFNSNTNIEGKHIKIYNPIIFFKHIIFKVAESLAYKLYKRDFLLISGDSLGQVSSQTISNLIATEILLKRETIIARPCIGFNKQEIIRIAKLIKTYDLSIEKYSDCCSKLSKYSKTATILEKLKEQDKKLSIEQIIKDALNTIKLVV